MAEAAKGPDHGSLGGAARCYASGPGNPSKRNALCRGIPEEPDYSDGAEARRNRGYRSLSSHAAPTEQHTCHCPTSGRERRA